MYFRHTGLLPQASRPKFNNTAASPCQVWTCPLQLISQTTWLKVTPHCYHSPCQVWTCLLQLISQTTWLKVTPHCNHSPCQVWTCLLQPNCAALSQPQPLPTWCRPLLLLWRLCTPLLLTSHGLVLLLHCGDVGLNASLFQDGQGHAFAHNSNLEAIPKSGGFLKRRLNASLCMLSCILTSMKLTHVSYDCSQG